MSNFRNFTFSKKNMDNDDASKSPHLRPFLLSLPQEEAMSVINSSSPNRRINRQNTVEMNTSIRDRPSSFRSTIGDSSNQTKVYIPFAPQKSDLEKLMAIERFGARCQRCNSNIVLCKTHKDSGDDNVKDFHLGEVFTMDQQQDENGAPVTVQVVWACRINRHVFPSSTANGTSLIDGTSICGTEDSPKRLTFAGAQRWVNELQGLMHRGDVGRAKECMTQIVLMNEGRKKESFTWLEKEKASRLSAALYLPKKIENFQQKEQPTKKEEEEPEVPDDGDKLLKEFFDEEGAAIYQMITSEDSSAEYSGLVIDSSSSESHVSVIATNGHGGPPTVPETKTTIASATDSVKDVKETLYPDVRSIDDSTSNTEAADYFPLPAQEDHSPPSDIINNKDKLISKRLSKHFSITNILTGFKKVSPSIKRVEGKHDLGKYAEEQAAAAAITPSMLPAQGHSMSLQDMLQEPFHRITEDSLKGLSRGKRASIISTTAVLSDLEMPELSLAGGSDVSSDTKPRTPSFLTDKSENGNDSARDIEHGHTVFTVISEPSGERCVSGNSAGSREPKANVVKTDEYGGI
ncbi:hypothetical protein TWF730_004404 [Orbilia blumenaviensis]|uniref:Uncharacterized protein n=1 Tax=Orbilia blumenaviensis TaxID=1796055 RepID=A0AAV9TXS6_9PEZI